MSVHGGPVVAGAALPRDVVVNPSLATWVGVGDDGAIEIRVGKVELGQGIVTALAQVAAEELDVPVSQLRMLPANTGTGPDEGLTAGSTSVADAGSALRVVCANVRALFVAAAARRWLVLPEEVTVVDGHLCTVAGDRCTTFGALAAAVDLRTPARADVTPKDPRTYRLVGSSAARLDLPDKVSGAARYIADLRLPGQLFGRVVRPPSPGARLITVDAEVVGSVAVDVVRDGSFLGVVGADEAVVVSAAERLRRAATWAEHDRLPDEDDLATFLTGGPHEAIPVVADEGPRMPAVRTLRARYTRPFLAHASIAPSCGVARWEPDGSVSIWSHTQGVHRLRDAVARALDLPSTTVTVQHVENAGCYGHNAADDAAFDAVLLARGTPGRPVQVQWSRRDELAWAPFGPAMVVDVEAGLGASGSVVSWSFDVWSQGHNSRPGYAGVPGLLAGAHLAGAPPLPAAADPPTRTGGGTVRNAVPVYDLPGRRITGHRLLDSPIRSSALRALGAHHNVFAIESFMDELAAAVGADPLEHRLRHLPDERARAVLTTAAEAADWGDPSPDGVARGIGLARYKDRGAYCAVVAEVEARTDIRVRRLTLAVDVGRVVNPDGVRMQIEGGAVQATSWTLKERVRFDRSRVTSDDWESYPILRFSEVPPVSVHVIDRPDRPSVGAGEAAQGPTAAALANAVAAAVGVRVRDLPLTPEAVVAAIEAAAP
ncbi:molybdopterin cofactor-binding domain-containing protein [Geodermatophilus sabuli]|uniref:molybdopterin cofactor-binding domain-containing protein n=1 Tax=Geodermatophilus sabuli TaxID=1564158 RepID=UPI0019543740